MTGRCCPSSGAWAGAIRRPSCCSPGSRRCSSASASSRTRSSWTSPTSGVAGPAKAPSWRGSPPQAGGGTWATGPASPPPPSPLPPGRLRATGATAAARTEATHHPCHPPPDKGDNASNCDCHAWDYGIRAGLVQNVVSKWDLVCDNAWKVHIAKFSLLVGLIFGYLITGCIADWVGRRPVLLFSIIFILIFGLTVALSVNVTMFSTLRFFEGFCLAGIILTLYALRGRQSSPLTWMTIKGDSSALGQNRIAVFQELCREDNLSLATPRQESVHGKLPYRKYGVLVLSCMPTTNDWLKLPENGEKTSKMTSGLSRREHLDPLAMSASGKEGG
ncbi:hypothetical protein H8959_010402 [Pygathrix nigripes]